MGKGVGKMGCEFIASAHSAGEGVGQAGGHMHTVVHVCTRQMYMHAWVGIRARWAKAVGGAAKGQEQECGHACALMLI